jgi:hypothetical protein
VGDESEFVDAERVLEQLGDIDQLERLTVARKTTSWSHMTATQERI